MLQNLRLLLGAVLLLVMAGSAKAQTGNLQQSPAFAAAKITASPTVKKLYDEDAKSWYAVYNTDSILHVYLAVTDPQQQRKIIMNGIELWIDTKGKKNKKTGIAYPYQEPGKKERPAPPAFSQSMARPNPFNTSDGHDTLNIHALQNMLAARHDMKLTGFKEDLNGIQNAHHPSGIYVSLNFIKDTLVYEAQLPLNTLSETVLLNSRIAVGIVEKGMTQSGMNENGMPPPDGGPGADGMMPLPGPYPGGEEGMRIFEDNSIWCKILLQQSNTVL